MSDATCTIDPILQRDGSDRRDAGLILLAADPPGSAPTQVAIGEELILGRDPREATATIEQSAVSRVHARVRRDAGGFTLEDLGSRNGAIVNGERITRPRRLFENDEVRVGNAIFKFVPSLDPYAIPVTVDATQMVVGPAFQRTMSELAKVSRTDLPILVLGETGTGKEVVTRAIHAKSGRRGKLAALNCAAIPTHLFESELFGHKKGAFTGAERDRVGLVASADKGTLFLDEIGDMPLDAQAKLLRLLETREVVPVGANEGERIDVRVVSATHRDLAVLADRGLFRADLLSRLRGHMIRLPPLRDRKEEIPVLAAEVLKRQGRPDVALDFAFMVGLLHYDWPYNVRELEVALRRALAVVDGDRLGEQELPEGVRESLATYGEREAPTSIASAAPHESAPSESREAPTRETLERLMREHAGNIAQVARVLAKDRSLVHRWLKRNGIDPAAYR